MENKNAQDIEMRLYDLNKTIMGQMPNVDKEVAIKVLKEYFDGFKDVPAYHMLLSAEGRDYTVFEFSNHICEDKIAEMINEIIEVLECRGSIKDIALNEGCIDIWVNDVYYKLFDYSWGVITV